MQHFSRPKKLLIIGPFFFSIANRLKTSSDHIFCSLKMSPCARNFYIMTLASENGDAFGGCAAVAAFFATILYGIKAYKLIKAIYEDTKNSKRSDV